MNKTHFMLLFVSLTVLVMGATSDLFQDLEEPSWRQEMKVAEDKAAAKIQHNLLEIREVGAVPGNKRMTPSSIVPEAESTTMDKATHKEYAARKSATLHAEAAKELAASILRAVGQGEQKKQKKASAVLPAHKFHLGLSASQQKEFDALQGKNDDRKDDDRKDDAILADHKFNPLSASQQKAYDALDEKEDKKPLLEEMLQVPETEFAEETASLATGSATGSAKANKIETPVAGEENMRSKIHKAIQVAATSLKGAKTKGEKTAAKAAVKEALADAGVADADNAGTVAWADRNLKVAKAWADKALTHDAKALGRVAAWTEGDRKKGKKMRRKCERAVQAMIAVASSTKNKEMVARENKLRQEGKMKSFDGAIKLARKSAMFAGKSVDAARGALAKTLGTKGRIAAKHALIRAQDALNDANKILEVEVTKKNIVTESRLQSDGAKLVGENEIHFQARKMFHRANRVLKLVEAALNSARKNHYQHKEASMKREQKVTMEKAAKLADKERTAKSEAKRTALGIKTKQEYAAYLANEALKYGNIASEDASKAAKAGKIAAEKAAESAHVKSKLGVKKPTSTATVTEALQRENIAADLAKKAAAMEDAIVTGGKIPQKVMQLLSDDNGKVRPTVFDEAQASAMEINTNLEQDEDFHEFVTHRKKWMAKYKKNFQTKKAQLSDKSPLA